MSPYNAFQLFSLLLLNTQVHTWYVVSFVEVKAGFHWGQAQEMCRDMSKVNDSLPDECETYGHCEYDMPSIDSMKDELKTIIASANKPVWVSAYYVKSKIEGRLGSYWTTRGPEPSEYLGSKRGLPHGFHPKCVWMKGILNETTGKYVPKLDTAECFDDTLIKHVLCVRYAEEVM